MPICLVAALWAVLSDAFEIMKIPFAATHTMPQSCIFILNLYNFLITPNKNGCTALVLRLAFSPTLEMPPQA
jgi:hypothetical protein